jgi:hypothetical protein
MRQKVGVKCQQCKSYESRPGAEHFLRRQEHQYRQQHNKERHRQARPKQHSLRVVAEKEFLEGIFTGRCRSGSAAISFTSGGCSGFNPKSPCFQDRVGAVVLIPRERIAMNGKRELYPKNGNQKHNAGNHPGSAAGRSRFT